MIVDAVLRRDFVLRPALENQLDRRFLGYDEVGVEADQVHQPATRHSRHQNGDDAAYLHQSLLISVFLTETGCTQSDAHPQKDKSSEDEPVELEVIFCSDAIVEPFAVVVKELHASSASLAMEAVIIWVKNVILM